MEYFVGLGSRKFGIDQNADQNVNKDHDSTYITFLSSQEVEGKDASITMVCTGHRSFSFLFFFELTIGVTFFNSGFKSDLTKLFPSTMHVIAS